MTEEKDDNHYVRYVEFRDLRVRVSDVEETLVRLDTRTSDNSNKLDDINSKLDNLVKERRVEKLEEAVDENRQDIEPISDAIQSALSVADLIRWLIASGFLTLIIVVLQILGILPAP